MHQGEQPSYYQSLDQRAQGLRGIYGNMFRSKEQQNKQQSSIQWREQIETLPPKLKGQVDAAAASEAAEEKLLKNAWKIMNSSIQVKEERDMNESLSMMMEREKKEAKQMKNVEKKSRNLVESIRKTVGVGEQRNKKGNEMTNEQVKKIMMKRRLPQLEEKQKTRNDKAGQFGVLRLSEDGVNTVLAEVLEQHAGGQVMTPQNQNTAGTHCFSPLNPIGNNTFNFNNSLDASTGKRTNVPRELLTRAGNPRHKKERSTFTSEISARPRMMNQSLDQARYSLQPYQYLEELNKFQNTTILKNPEMTYQNPEISKGKKFLSAFTAQKEAKQYNQDLWRFRSSNPTSTEAQRKYHLRGNTLNRYQWEKGLQPIAMDKYLDVASSMNSEPGLTATTQSVHLTSQKRRRQPEYQNIRVISNLGKNKKVSARPMLNQPSPDLDACENYIEAQANMKQVYNKTTTSNINQTSELKYVSLDFGVSANTTGLENTIRSQLKQQIRIPQVVHQSPPFQKSKEAEVKIPVVNDQMAEYQSPMRINAFSFNVESGAARSNSFKSGTLPFGISQVRDSQDEHSGQHSKNPKYSNNQQQFVSVSWTNESLNERKISGEVHSNESPTPSQSGDIESEKRKKSSGNHLKHISSNITPMRKDSKYNTNQPNATAVKSKAKGKKKDIAFTHLHTQQYKEDLKQKAEELEKMDVLHFGSFRNSSQKVSNSDLKHDLDVGCKEQVKEKPPWHGGQKIIRVSPSKFETDNTHATQSTAKALQQRRKSSRKQAKGEPAKQAKSILVEEGQHQVIQSQILENNGQTEVRQDNFYEQAYDTKFQVEVRDKRLDHKFDLDFDQEQLFGGAATARNHKVATRNRVSFAQSLNAGAATQRSIENNQKSISPKQQHLGKVQFQFSDLPNSNVQNKGLPAPKFVRNEQKENMKLQYKLPTQLNQTQHQLRQQFERNNNTNTETTPERAPEFEQRVEGQIIMQKATVRQQPRGPRYRESIDTKKCDTQTTQTIEEEEQQNSIECPLITSSAVKNQDERQIQAYLQGTPNHIKESNAGFQLPSTQLTLTRISPGQSSAGTALAKLETQLQKERQAAAQQTNPMINVVRVQGTAAKKRQKNLGQSKQLTSEHLLPRNEEASRNPARNVKIELSAYHASNCTVGLEEAGGQQTTSWESPHASPVNQAANPLNIDEQTLAFQTPWPRGDSPAPGDEGINPSINKFYQHQLETTKVYVGVRDIQLGMKTSGPESQSLTKLLLHPINNDISFPQNSVQAPIRVPVERMDNHEQTTTNMNASISSAGLKQLQPKLRKSGYLQSSNANSKLSYFEQQVWREHGSPSACGELKATIRCARLKNTSIQSREIAEQIYRARDPKQAQNNQLVLTVKPSDSQSPARGFKSHKRRNTLNTTLIVQKQNRKQTTKDELPDERDRGVEMVKGKQKKLTVNMICEIRRRAQKHQGSTTKANEKQ